ncbi:MAG: AAA-like domain-containing protein [Paludibacteraceae bacterium]|nr:AAA-like domain-containing protein [Paludibacteraceae bacterium]
MAKRFNTTGSCNPQRHYMVNIDDKLAKIEELINEGLYFTINRARQFGKTTTMKMLLGKLSYSYQVYQISFETDADMFSSQEDFCRGLFLKLSKAPYISQDQIDFWKRSHDCKTFENLSDVISEFCNSQDKPVVLMIDEVDKSTDNQLFLHFLGMLRNKYLDRDTNGMDSTFHSVILAGVYDVKNLKLKIRNDEEKKYNSPWNIAVRFNVDMTLSAEGIKGMLDEYESDYHTGMDTKLIADEIRRMTSGYPFLVSYICSLIHEEFSGNWSVEGIHDAIKTIIKDKYNTLMSDMTKNLEIYPDFKTMMKDILLYDAEIMYDPNVPAIDLATTFSVAKEDANGHVMVHNLVFEQKLYNYFISEASLRRDLNYSENRSKYVKDGRLNMPLVIERFKDLLEAENKSCDEEFLEKQGRLLFLCFLKPIINGTGFYYVEPQTRNDGRMDIVVSYGGEEFIIELKVWRGMKYEAKGEIQVSEYANVRGLKKAYLITFSFLKEKVVQVEPEWKTVNGVDVYEGIIWAKRQ